VTSPISYQNVIGQSVLIIGDAGAGKSQLTVRLVDEAIADGMSEHITVIDMAPTTRFVESLKIGGQLREMTPHLNEVRYLAPSRIETPRLSARSSQELQHSGSLSLVTQAISATDTCIVNGYYGQSIKTEIEDPVSRIERALMDRLIDSMDIVVTL
jgi:GTPase SAR1 family protein